MHPADTVRLDGEQDCPKSHTCLDLRPMSRVRLDPPDRAEVKAGDAAAVSEATLVGQGNPGGRGHVPLTAVRAWTTLSRSLSCQSRPTTCTPIGKAPL